MNIENRKLENHYKNKEADLHSKIHQVYHTSHTTTTATTNTNTMSDLIEETATGVNASTSNKRQRLSSTGDYNKKGVQGSPVGSMAGIAMATRSRSRSPSLLPTFEKLAKELCKIVDTDHHSRNDAKRALANVSRWGYTGDDNPNSTFLSDLSELGGIQLVLLFLKNNQSDPSCVMVAMKVIMACTHRPFDHPNHNIANEITRYFIMRNGIKIVLNAGKELYNDNNNDTNKRGGGDGDGGDHDNDTITSAAAATQQLHALRWIWMVLMNVTGKTSTFETVDKEQLLAIFDSFLETMTRLGLRNAATANAATTITNNKTVVSPKKSEGSNSIGQTVQPDACESAADTSLNIVQRAFSFCSPTAPRKRSFIETTAREQHPQGNKGEGIDKITSTDIATPTTTTTVDINKAKEKSEVVNTRLTSLILEDMFSTLTNVSNNAHMTRDDFQGMDLISKCIEALKKPNGEWIDNNKELYIHASRFFVQCSKKDILSTKNDFEAAFPLIVECIRRYPEDSFKGELFDLVRNAYSVVYDKSFIQGSGILGAVATVLQSHYISETTKDASHQLLKELLD